MDRRSPRSVLVLAVALLPVAVILAPRADAISLGVGGRGGSGDSGSTMAGPTALAAIGPTANGAGTTGAYAQPAAAAGAGTTPRATSKPRRTPGSSVAPSAFP